MEYSQKEIALLSDACVSAFLLVAGADGRITKAETQAFFENHIKRLKSRGFLITSTTRSSWSF